MVESPVSAYFNTALACSLLNNHCLLPLPARAARAETARAPGGLQATLGPLGSRSVWSSRVERCKLAAQVGVSSRVALLYENLEPVRSLHLTVARNSTLPRALTTSPPTDHACSCTVGTDSSNVLPQVLLLVELFDICRLKESHGTAATWRALSQRPHLAHHSLESSGGGLSPASRRHRAVTYQLARAACACRGRGSRTGLEPVRSLH